MRLRFIFAAHLGLSGWLGNMCPCVMTSSCLQLMAFDIVIDNKVAGGRNEETIQLHATGDFSAASVLAMHSDLAVLGNHLGELGKK